MQISSEPTEKSAEFLFNPDGLPSELMERPQWIVWRLEYRDGKGTKVPYDPKTVRLAACNDLLTWASFDVAFKQKFEGSYDGLGFVLCSADPLVGLDFDNCRDPETGEITEDVLEIVRLFESKYVEASVSGTGVHLITTGKLRGGSKKGDREIYGQDRFFTMSGVNIDV